VRVHEVLAPGGARPQHVEAHARHHSRQPTTEVLDAVGVGAAESQPRVLHRVVGLAQRTEHPVRDRAQVGAVLFESGSQEFLFVHRHIPLSSRVIGMTRPRGRM
jgi:hypothetical protein